VKISVVIPTYNRKEELRRALDSILNQTIRFNEIIVVDGGSDDGTKLVLQEYAVREVRTLVQTGEGVSNARNEGIRESTNEWVAFLDSDDWWLPNKLEEQVRFHLNFPRYLISQTDEIWIRNNIRVNPKKYHLKKGGRIFDLCLERCMITPSAVLINKCIFDDVGLFDESLPVCEDYDLWLRVAKKYEVGLIEEKLVVKTGGHPDQLSVKYWGMDRFRVKALEKMLEEPLGLEEKKGVLDTLIKKSWILAQGSTKRNETTRAQLYQEKTEEYQEMLRSLNEAGQVSN